MRLLLHVCCGPCSIFPVKWLQEHNYDIVGYFYNPNIHPYKEFVRRIDTLKEFAEKTSLEVVIDDRYQLEEFLGRALEAKGQRCSMCYELRLRQVARYAKEHHFDCFSTTLLVSPYQKHDDIKAIAEKIAQEESVAFQYVDFRPGWTEGVIISKEMELYRQPYCGCIFSEKERYCKTKK